MALGLTSGNINIELSHAKISNSKIIGYMPDPKSNFSRYCIIFFSLTLWMWSHITLSVLGVSSFFFHVNIYTCMIIFGSMLLIFNIVRYFSGCVLFFEHYGFLEKNKLGCVYDV